MTMGCIPCGSIQRSIIPSWPWRSASAYIWMHGTKNGIRRIPRHDHAFIIEETGFFHKFPVPPTARKANFQLDSPLRPFLHLVPVLCISVPAVKTVPLFSLFVFVQIYHILITFREYSFAISSSSAGIVWCCC